MKFGRGTFVAGLAVASVVLASPAQAHWCDDLWASSYNIVVRPESDTVSGGSMNVYVQNNMGYQLINFKLTASAGSTALTVTAPTLKSGTLLPGQKAIWKISGSGFTKIEDVAFSVSFGNPGQSACYPTKNAKAVMVVKTDGTLYPAPPALPGLDTTVSPPGCAGDMTQGRSLQYQAMADFEDVNTGLDKLMTLYCSGRGSFGSTDGVTMANCRDNSSTTCPTNKPAAKTGSKYDYMHLWAAGELAARKSVLGSTRLPTFRKRLQCGVNDNDVGFAGYALFMLGYLGEDTDARSFIQTQITSGSGDMAAIAKAALLLMGSAADMTTYKADVTAGLKSSSTFVAAASAAALGIVSKDDAAVTGTLIPLVKWNEPDNAQEDGQGLYAAHLLALVAWDRRQWAANGGDKGAITFYGDVATGTGGATGNGGSTGAGGIGAGGAVAAGGASGSTGNRDAGAAGGAKAGGGASGNAGAVAVGGAVASGGNGQLASGGAQSAGGAASGGGQVSAGGGSTSTGPAGNGGESGSGGAGGGSTATKSSGGCALAGQAKAAPAGLLLVLGLALAVRRRRYR